jgi:hypothetical protein
MGASWRKIGSGSGPALILVVTLLVGCTIVSVQPKVPRDAQPSEINGYVGGLFDKDTIVGFGFGLQDEQTGKEYVLELEDNVVGLVAVPPGRYRVAYWVTWAALTGDRLTQQAIPRSHPFGHDFEVRPGQVTFLGHWSADRQMHFRSNTFTLAPVAITEAEARDALHTAYPSFATERIQCVFCAL